MPLMVWDGNCRFCELCANRFKYLAKGSIEFLPYQELKNKYPKAPDFDYKKSVYLFTKSGASNGAAAVFNYYNLIGKKFLFWLYQKSKLFEKSSEFFYEFIARNRNKFRVIGHFFYGSDFLPDKYRISAWIYGRALGLVGFVAFLSFWMQADILIGSNGIIPFADDLKEVENYLIISDSSSSKWSIRPTLLWFSKHDIWLNSIIGLGLFSSVFLFLGLLPPISIAISWLCYLSISVVSEPFLNFQWDTLLLESYLLSIFFVPWVIIDKKVNLKSPSLIGRYLIWFLIMKLMFESGLVKLTFFSSEGTNTWRDLTALDFHYWTQPIPSWISYYLDLLPGFIDNASLWFMYYCELIVPFMIIFPRRIKRVACFSLITFQVLIIISGNYGFFNLLSIVLCITLIDDQFIIRYFNNWNLGNNKTELKSILYYIKNIFGSAILILFLWTFVVFIKKDLHGSKPLNSKDEPSFLNRKVLAFTQATRSINAYGLFRVMTVQRPEIIIELLGEDSTWVPVAFNYKPVEVNKRPKLFFPHMPRIDWQMWFEALYFDRLKSDPFSLSTYQRFLKVIVENDLSMDELSLNSFFNDEDRKLLESLPKLNRDNFVNRFRVNINNHINNSYWFARLLSKMVRQELVLKNEFQFDTNTKIQKMRVSLFYYKFNSDLKDGNNEDWWVINKNNSSVILFDLDKNKINHE